MNKDLLQKAGTLVSEILPGMIMGARLGFIKEHKVTQLQFITLITVSRLGGCTMSKLAKTMDMSFPQATGIIDRLMEMGMVKRESSLKDRRIVFISLGTKGRAFMDSFKKTVKARWMEMLSVLKDNELVSFVNALEKVGEKL